MSKIALLIALGCAMQCSIITPAAAPASDIEKLQEGKEETEEEGFVVVGQDVPAHTEQVSQLWGSLSTAGSAATSAIESVRQHAQSYFYPSIPEYDEQDPNAKQIITLMDTLNTIAQKKNQPFDEGAYVIEDPNGMLFKFLSEFNNGKGNYTYHRISSHFPERLAQVRYDLGKFGGIETGSQGYGIDIPLPLPYDKKNHILFNQFDLKGKRYLFIKPESYGTSWGHLAPHTKEYFQSLYRKWTAPEANEGEKMRKEHTPQLIKKGWQDLIEHSKFESRQKKELQAEGLQHGIYKMLDIIEQNQQKMRKDKLENFVKSIKDSYDHVDIRKGNEVIITEKELIEALKQTAPNLAAQLQVAGEKPEAQALMIPAEDQKKEIEEKVPALIIEEYFKK